MGDINLYVIRSGILDWERKYFRTEAQYVHTETQCIRMETRYGHMETEYVQTEMQNIQSETWDVYAKTRYVDTQTLDNQTHPDLDQSAYTDGKKNTINMYVQVFLRMNTWLFETYRRQYN